MLRKLVVVGLQVVYKVTLVVLNFPPALAALTLKSIVQADGSCRLQGLLKNGAIVAVKKLSNSICMDENKYNQEVSCLMKVKHRNVVRFLGYCADTQGKMDYGGKFVMADIRERLLCFEYVPNGTLKDYITGMIKWLCLSFFPFYYYVEYYLVQAFPYKLTEIHLSHS